MELCYITLKAEFGQKGHWSETLILLIGVPIVLFINFLIGGAIRQLFGALISNEEVSDPIRYSSNRNLASNGK
jgi:hypothetical protein